MVMIVLAVLALVSCSVVWDEPQMYEVTSDIHSLDIQINAADFSIVDSDAFCNDKGFLCWQETGGGAEIVAIHSFPESWGTGLGHAMLTEALAQIGDRTVILWAFKENIRARRFYEKHGFRWDGNERVSEFDGAMEVRYVRKSP